MPTPINVLGFAGSLRRASTNRGLLRAAAEVLPAGMTLEVFDLAPIPLYNADIEAAGVPDSVKLFKQLLASADAILIATPEYNYSIPGVLKNAIDWASRPPQDCPLVGKPLAIMGAGGTYGTVRSQLALRHVAVYTNMLPLNKPEVMVQRNWEKFDEEGNLIHEATKEQVRDLLAALASWTRRLRDRSQ
jgi:chromate reductase, NAD(P)H dehydrogenase (quinone)